MLNVKCCLNEWKSIKVSDGGANATNHITSLVWWKVALSFVEPSYNCPDNTHLPYKLYYENSNTPLMKAVERDKLTVSST